MWNPWKHIRYMTKISTGEAGAESILLLFMGIYLLNRITQNSVKVLRTNDKPACSRAVSGSAQSLTDAWPIFFSPKITCSDLPTVTCGPCYWSQWWPHRNKCSEYVFLCLLPVNVLVPYYPNILRYGSVRVHHQFVQLVVAHVRKQF